MKKKSNLSLNVMTYNIHKGFDTFKKGFVLDKIKQSIHLASADIVFLQEVVGSSGLGNHQSQFEFIADSAWTHYSYGKNSVSTSGHHGNAILSKYPFTFTTNIDLSLSKIEKRGMIHGIIKIPGSDQPIHLICTHLNLLEKDRRIQTIKIVHYIKENIPDSEPIILAGDFNDWRNSLTKYLEKTVNLKECFMETQGECASSFPGKLPVLKLDRIYFRHLSVIDSHIHEGKPWSQLSDHLALSSTLKMK
jgi:endonuclease/exonuclease/phosphatase family metal-dependent hydrolase